MRACLMQTLLGFLIVAQNHAFASQLSTLPAFTWQTRNTSILSTGHRTRATSQNTTSPQSQNSMSKVVDLQGNAWYHEQGSEWCTLWNKTCTGNVTLAMNDFFNASLAMWPAYACTGNKTEDACDHFGNLGGLQYADALESWMRSPACLVTSSIWSKEQPKTADLYQYPNRSSCCEACNPAAFNHY